MWKNEISLLSNDDLNRLYCCVVTEFVLRSCSLPVVSDFSPAAAVAAPIKLILYTHRCKESANHHKGKYKHWSKVISAVDTNKTNGYAFSGEFLNISAEHKLPAGAIVVEVCANEITALRINECIEILATGEVNKMSSFIETMAEYFTK